MADKPKEKTPQEIIQEETYRILNGPFQKGDVVKLKSGGPKMTVVPDPTDTRPKGIPDDNKLCMYFKGSDIVTFYFDPATLTGAPESNKE